MLVEGIGDATGDLLGSSRALCLAFWIRRLHVAQRFEVFADLVLSGAELLLTLPTRRDRIENSLACCASPCARATVLSLAPNSRSNTTRVVSHQRSVGVSPKGCCCRRSCIRSHDPTSCSHRPLTAGRQLRSRSNAFAAICPRHAVQYQLSTSSLARRRYDPRRVVVAPRRPRSAVLSASPVTTMAIAEFSNGRAPAKTQTRPCPSSAVLVDDPFRMVNDANAADRFACLL